MKTQIIQLEQHDDIISARDKMGWSQTNRILLIWPPKGKILNRKLDLVLLLRHSFNLGAQLALVTSDDEVRYKAQELQIPVFKSVREAQSTRWRTAQWRRSRSFRKRPRPDLEQLREQTRSKPGRWEHLPAVRITAFCLSLAALLSLLLMILPGAQIEVAPVVQEQKMRMSISANPEARFISQSGEIPARWKTIQVEGRRTISSTGQTFLPYKPAEGIAVFTNLTDQEVVIPAGTVVSTLGTRIVRFKTTRESKVWAGPGQISLVPIKAVVWGTTGNQPPNTIKAIEGSLGLKLSVNNPSPTQKGADIAAPAPSQEDKARLFDQLQTELKESAANELMRTYHAQPNQADFPILPTLRRIRIVEENYTPEAGEPGEELQLRLRLEFEVMAISGEDLRVYVEQFLDSSLPGNFHPQPQTLTIQHLGTPQLDELGNAHWSVEGSRKVTALLDSQEIIRRIVGRHVEGISDYLKGLPVQAQFKVQLFPNWWPYFPFLSFRIRVQDMTAVSGKELP